MDQDDQIKNLQRELDDARHALIRVACRSLPHDVYSTLINFYQCKIEQDWWRWENVMVEKVIAIAKPDPKRRAYCPLCKEGTTQQWGQETCGFLLPLGLEWHLKGRGRMNQCEVIEAAFALSQNYLIPKFKHQELQKQIFALTTIQQICETAGCKCDIVESENYIVLMRCDYNSQRHSWVHALNDTQFKVDSTGGMSLPTATPKEAADVLIWEERNPGKRWMKGRI